MINNSGLLFWATLYIEHIELVPGINTYV